MTFLPDDPLKRAETLETMETITLGETAEPAISHDSRLPETPDAEWELVFVEPDHIAIRPKHRGDGLDLEPDVWQTGAKPSPPIPR